MKTLKTLKTALAVFSLLLLLAGPCRSGEASIKVIREPSGRLSLTAEDLATLLSHNRNASKANAQFDEEYQKLLRLLEETRRSLRCS